MKRNVLLLFITLCLVSCQKHTESLCFYGFPIDGTIQQFMDAMNEYPNYLLYVDSIYYLSEDTINIDAYTRQVVNIDQNTFKTDSINVQIVLDKQYINEFAYTMNMSLSEYNAIITAYECRYGAPDYYDITEFRHICGRYLDKKNYMYINYDIHKQKICYLFIINRMNT